MPPKRKIKQPTPRYDITTYTAKMKAKAERMIRNSNNPGKRRPIQPLCLLQDQNHDINPAPQAEELDHGHLEDALLEQNNNISEYYDDILDDSDDSIQQQQQQQQPQPSIERVQAAPNSSEVDLLAIITKQNALLAALLGNQPQNPFKQTPIPTFNIAQYTEIDDKDDEDDNTNDNPQNGDNSTTTDNLQSHPTIILTWDQIEAVTNPDLPDSMSDHTFLKEGPRNPSHEALVTQPSNNIDNYDATTTTTTTTTTTHSTTDDYITYDHLFKSVAGCDEVNMAHQTFLAPHEDFLVSFGLARDVVNDTVQVVADETVQSPLHPNTKRTKYNHSQGPLDNVQLHSNPQLQPFPPPPAPPNYTGDLNNNNKVQNDQLEQNISHKARSLVQFDLTGRLK